MSQSIKNRKRLLMLFVLVLFILANVFIYLQLADKVIPRLVHANIDISPGGDAAGNGMTKAFAYMLYAPIVYIAYFVFSYFLSRKLFAAWPIASGWPAIVAPLLGFLVYQALEEQEANRVWVVKEYYETGELKSERESMRAISYHGQATTYYRNGNIQSIRTYRNDLLNGFCQEFYENGQLKFEGTMKGKCHGEPRSDSDRMLTGTCKFYLEDGTLDDVRRYDPETGELIHESVYRSGEQVSESLEK